MTSKYVPELGQAIFGNAWEEYGVPGSVDGLLVELAYKLNDSIYGSPIYGVEYENEVFSMFPYYWGDCTCGFEEEDELWWETHHHKPDCFCVKYERYTQQLEKQGIKLFSEEGRCLIERFVKENGGPNKGYAVYCNCGLDEEYAKWRETHYHSPDCPVIRPNFLYKPTGLAIHWYKYIGRGMSANQKVTLEEMAKIIQHCIQSAQKDIEKATWEKERQQREQKKWQDEKDAKGYICHRCFHFWGEDKDGNVYCTEFVEEHMQEDGTVFLGGMIPHEYRKECEYFVEWEKESRK